ncbi:MAG: hypothetical protein HN802_02660 [Candidatus Jacksonbacteria bacterium]|jgi:hypothetical protein|nr:hypothetical protein [Candidatus Jacksonbacteria bacterium]
MSNTTWKDHFTFYKLTHFSKITGRENDSEIVRVGKNTGTCYTYRKHDNDNSYGYSQKKAWCSEIHVLDFIDDETNPKVKWNDKTWDIEEIPFDIAMNEVTEDEE